MKAVALVGRVTDVQPHPDNNELRNKMDIVTISGRTNVANRPSPDEPRYKIGDFAVMLTENMILPDVILKHLDLWDSEKNQGVLSGKQKNRLKPRAIGLSNKIFSEVALVKCLWTVFPTKTENGCLIQEGIIKFESDTIPDRVITKMISAVLVVNDPDNFSPEGEDVAFNLGIEEIYE